MKDMHLTIIFIEEDYEFVENSVQFVVHLLGWKSEALNT